MNDVSFEFIYQGCPNFLKSGPHWFTIVRRNGPQLTQIGWDLSEDQSRVVTGPISSSPNSKTNLKPKSCPKNPKVKLGLKKSAMLPSYFDCNFVHLRQKVCLRPELSPKLCQLQARTRPEPGPNPKSPARLTTLDQSHNSDFI